MKLPGLLCAMLALLTIVLRGQITQLPYYTGFDSPGEKAGWSEYRLGYASNFNWTNSGQLFHDYNVGGTSTQTVVDWYVSPALNLNIPAKITMKVKASGVTQPTNDNCEVYFSSSAADPAMSTYTLIGNLSLTQPLDKWAVKEFTILGTASSGRIAFRFKSISAYWMTYAIDSITVKSSTVVSILNYNKPFEIDLFRRSANEFMLTCSEPLWNSQLTLSDLNDKALYTSSIQKDRNIILDFPPAPGIYLICLAGPEGIIRKKMLLNDD
jgi:hypothetical protein